MERYVGLVVRVGYDWREYGRAGNSMVECLEVMIVSGRVDNG